MKPVYPPLLRSGGINIFTEDIVLPGYTEPFRKDRNCFGGGILVYIASHLHAKRRSDLEYNNCEFIWFEVIFPRYKILICVVYRPPGAADHFWECFHNSVERAFESSSKILISGDLNINLLNEQNNSLIDLMNIFNLKNLITKPTRLGALLDPVLCSDECDISFSDVIQVDRAFSDHEATFVSLRIPFNLQTSYNRDVWLYKHGNFEGFNLEIDNFDWNSFLLSVNDVDEMAIKFSDKYLEMAKSFIPSKTVTIRPTDKPWFNSAIRKEIRTRDRLHKHFTEISHPEE